MWVCVCAQPSWHITANYGSPHLWPRDARRWAPVTAPVLVLQCFVLRAVLVALVRVHLMLRPWILSLELHA